MGRCTPQTATQKADPSRTSPGRSVCNKRERSSSPKLWQGSHSREEFVAAKSRTEKKSYVVNTSGQGTDIPSSKPVAQKMRLSEHRENPPVCSIPKRSLVASERRHSCEGSTKELCASVPYSCSDTVREAQTPSIAAHSGDPGPAGPPRNQDEEEHDQMIFVICPSHKRSTVPIGACLFCLDQEKCRAQKTAIQLGIAEITSYDTITLISEVQHNSKLASIWCSLKLRKCRHKAFLPSLLIE